MPEVSKTIYTDGGCHNTGDKKGIGAWAFVEHNMDNDIVKVHASYVGDTTNNRTEMLAVIEAIKSIDDGSLINIISDSGYVVKGYNHPSYLDSWIKSGWKTSTNGDVQNRDLWEEILKLSYHKNIKFNLIRGHYKDPSPLHAFWNSIVDKACTYMMQNFDIEHKHILEFDIRNKKFTVKYPHDTLPHEFHKVSEINIKFGRK